MKFERKHVQQIVLKENHDAWLIEWKFYSSIKIRVAVWRILMLKSCCSLIVMTIMVAVGGGENNKGK